MKFIITNRYFNRVLFLGDLICLCFLFACGLVPINTQPPKPVATMLPQYSPTPSLTLTQIVAVPTATHTQTPVIIEFVLSSQAGDFVGETVTIKIEKAYCSYRPDVNGAPTFCNDQPFPNHTFTLITWGRDWTDLDGKCVYIEGEVEVYKGKYEIIADSRDQVIICD